MDGGSHKPVLYVAYGTRASKALWMALELGVDVEIKRVRLDLGEHKQPDFLRINPAGTVPALVDGDLVLTESLAIALYFLDKYDTDHKLGCTVGTPDRAKLYDIGAFTTSSLETPAAEAFLHGVFWKPPMAKPEVAEAARKKWKDSLGALCDGKLGDKQYVLGDHFTAADVLFGYGLNVASKGGLLAEHPKLAAYIERITAREAFKLSHIAPENRT